MPKSEERCREIREETRDLIVRKSALYFARNGFSGTKISDLSKNIGIAQGSIYNYFESKEELFAEVYSISDKIAGVHKLDTVAKLPFLADKKIRMLSDHIIKNIKKDEMFSAGIALFTQRMLEGEADNSFYKTVAGSAAKLAEYYWGVVYLYALKSLYTEDPTMITASDLSRILLRDK